MHRNVTAIYRTREVAELVRRALEDIGVPARDIHIVPDPAGDTPAARAHAPGGDRTTTGTGAGAAPRGTTAAARDPGGISGTGPAGAAVPQHPAAGEHPLHNAGYLEQGSRDAEVRNLDRLHELHLPEEDVRTYQHCVRRGDYVVSAEVDDAKVEKVKAVMRRPETEAHDIEHRASEFRNEDIMAHSAGEGHMLNEEWRARRLAAGDDRYTRTYERDRRLENLGRI